MTLDEILAELMRKLSAATEEKEPETAEEYEAQFKKRAAESAEVRALLDSRDGEISTAFVLHLFNTARVLCAGSSQYGSGYMAKLAEDPGCCSEHKLDELKREHDLKGFNQKLAKPRMDAANITNKKKRAKSKKPDALKVLAEWSGSREDFIKFCAGEYGISERQAERWHDSK